MIDPVSWARAAIQTHDEPRLNSKLKPLHEPQRTNKLLNLRPEDSMWGVSTTRHRRHAVFSVCISTFKANRKGAERYLDMIVMFKTFFICIRSLFGGSHQSKIAVRNVPLLKTQKLLDLESANCILLDLISRSPLSPSFVNQ